MDAYLARRRASIPRAGLFLAISGLLLAACAGTSPGFVGGASGPVTAVGTSGGEPDKGIRVPSSRRAHAVVSPFGPGGRVGTWPG